MTRTICCDITINFLFDFDDCSSWAILGTWGSYVLVDQPMLVAVPILEDSPFTIQTPSVSRINWTLYSNSDPCFVGVCVCVMCQGHLDWQRERHTHMCWHSNINILLLNSMLGIFSKCLMFLFSYV